MSVIYVITVATVLIKNIPAPVANPIAEIIHRLAAVVRPRTVIPSCKIVPAPKKPIPLTTEAAIRDESRPFGYSIGI